MVTLRCRCRAISVRLTSWRAIKSTRRFYQGPARAPGHDQSGRGMNEVVSSRSLTSPAHRSARWPKILALVVLVIGVASPPSSTTSSAPRRFSPGCSRAMPHGSRTRSSEGRAPASPSPGGPFDTQRGYPRLGDFRRRLESAGYTVAEQARQSAGMVRFIRWGVTPPYREPAVAGLVIRDFRGESIYDGRPGDALFPSFEEVPPLIVSTLLFLENRELTNPTGPGSNPAIDWGRLERPADSTSPAGSDCPCDPKAAARWPSSSRSIVTRRAAAPLRPRQAAPAHRGEPARVSRRADSTASRQEIVLDYLQHHAAGRRAWIRRGARPRKRASRVVRSSILTAWRARSASPGSGPAKAAAYKLRAGSPLRRPRPHPLPGGGSALLDKKITAYGDLLLKAGVIDRELNRELHEASLRFGGHVDQPPIDFAERRAATAIREDVRRILGVRSPWEMDRLHLEIESTIDGTPPGRRHPAFNRLGDKAFVDAHGLRAERLLLTGDPSRVVYSLLSSSGRPRATCSGSRPTISTNPSTSIRA